MSIFNKSTLKKKIDFDLSDINSKSEIDELLLKNLKEKVGNKCSKEGFVKKDSIKILHRGIGKIPASHFNGKIRYDITFSVEICDPPIGSIIECKVINKNKMGIIAESIEEKSPLIILVATQHHMENQDYMSIEIGSIIFVEVIGKKYELNDTKISIISKFTHEKKQTINLEKEEKIDRIEIRNKLVKNHGNKMNQLSEKEINNLIDDEIKCTSDKNSYIMQSSFPDDEDSDDEETNDYDIESLDDEF